MPQIVDGQGLMEVFHISKSILKRLWRSWPHMYVGTGRDLRAARFDVADVVNYLKSQGENYGAIQRFKNGEMDGQVRLQG